MPSDLVADVDHHVRRGELQHRALDDAVFSHGLFGLSGEVFERGSEVFAGVLVLRTGAGCGASSLRILRRIRSAAGRSLLWSRLRWSWLAVGSASVTTAVVDSELWAVVSSDKVMPLC